MESNSIGSSKNDITVIKCNIVNILYSNVDYTDFFDKINSVNTFIFNLHNFIRYSLLRLFTENKLNDAIINFSRFIKDSSCVMVDMTGSVGKRCNPPKYLNTFFEDFSTITGIKQQKLHKFSHIKDSEIVKIETGYTNNIKLHFRKYFNKFINETFNTEKCKKIEKRYNKNELKELSESERIAYINLLNENKEIRKRQKILFKELNPVKNDILTNTLNSVEKYHKFITETREELFDENVEDILIDIKFDPMKYLVSLLKMNRLLEEKQSKLFQPLPLRTDLSNKYLTLTTEAIKQIFMTDNENTYDNELGKKRGKINDNLRKYVIKQIKLKKDYKTEIYEKLINEQQENRIKECEIWSKYFDLSKFKKRNFKFGLMMETDGYAVSLIFMNDAGFESKNKEIVNKCIGKLLPEEEKKKNKLLQEKIKEEKQKLIESLKKKQKEIIKEKRNKIIQIKTEIKNLKKHDLHALELATELNKIENEIKQKTNRIKKKQEFEYIEDVLMKDPIGKEEIIKKWNANKIVCCDPGKKRIGTMVGQDEKSFFIYSSNMRRAETKSNKYSKLRNNTFRKLLSKNGKEIMKELCKYSYKSTKEDIFNEYLKNKYKLIETLKEESIEVGQNENGKITEVNIENNKIIKENKKSRKVKKSKKRNRLMTRKKLNKQKANKRKQEKKIKIQETPIKKKEIDIKEVSKRYYLNEYLNKLKWFGYLNKCRHEEKILQKIEKVYGKDYVFIIGDWSQKDGIKGMPTIGIGFKRLLEKKFKVYLIDEYKTSKTYYNNKLKEAHELIHAKNELSGNEIYSVLTCKMKNGMEVYVNRDRNAVKNMLKLTENYIKQSKEGIKKIARIKAFQREEKRS